MLQKWVCIIIKTMSCLYSYRTHYNVLPHDTFITVFGFMAYIHSIRHMVLKYMMLSITYQQYILYMFVLI